MNDISLIKILIIEIQKKLKLTDFRSWNNSIYTELSELIYQQTDILLSRNTLKNLVNRILKNDSNYSPQLSTKNALAQFAGYKNWSDYNTSMANSDKASDYESEITKEKNHPYLRIVLAVVMLIAIGIAVYYFIFPQKATQLTPEFTINILEPSGKAPHTITLQYDFSKLPNKDSISFDFDTYSAAGKYELKEFKQIMGVENFCYYHPGYYNTSLYINGKPMKQFNILIESNGWNASVFDAQMGKIHRNDISIANKSVWPRFIDFDNIIQSDFIQDGFLYVSKNQALAIKDIPKNYKTCFRNFRDFNTNGDNFSMNVRFVNQHYGEETFCYSAEFTVFCSNGRINFRLMQPGCKLYAQYQFSEVQMDGIKNTVEGFEHDFSYPRIISFKNNGKNIELAIDDSIFHKNMYKNELGNIVGLEMVHKNAVMVDFIELLDINGIVTYRDDFNN